MSNKYIIRKCPMYFHGNCYGHTGNCDCSDCTDCVIKQIVDKCKEKYYESSNIALRVFTNEILQLLDIQEVE